MKRSSSPTNDSRLLAYKVQPNKFVHVLPFGHVWLHCMILGPASEELEEEEEIKPVCDTE